LLFLSRDLFFFSLLFSEFLFKIPIFYSFLVKYLSTLLNIPI